MASTVPTPPNPDPHADRRVYPRVEVALPAFLQANGERHAVRILDLSAGGAKLDCPVGLPSGTAVIFGLGPLGRAAMVPWQNAGVLGICLDSELAPRGGSALAGSSKDLTAWAEGQG